MRYLLLCLIAACVVGCTPTVDTDRQDRLAGACQVRKCACAPAGWTQFSAGGQVPIRWAADGSAFCPEGFSLHTVDPPPTRR